MRVFLLAVLTVALLGTATYFGLNMYQQRVDQAYATTGVRVPVN